MPLSIQLGDITVDVLMKDIKHVHLGVHPPSGRVRISAPSRMKLDVIRSFAVTKLGWIKRQQAILQKQERETPREYIERESHYIWGRRYLLKLIEVDAAPTVQVSHHKLVLCVRPGADLDTKEAVVADWYRHQLKNEVPALIAKWEPLMGVKVGRFFVQRMKTKWGSCNAKRRTIRLNTELAKKPRECLEYVVVHEMAHLRERNHNARFVEMMDRFLPKWRANREVLNRLPIRHERWMY
jgi:predicted metal-dependent hydrolase